MPLPTTAEEVKELLERAAEDLFASDAVAEFTVDTRQSEWNLTQHFATAVQGYLPELRHDVDPIKVQAGGRRPDIVFHRANTHRSNYLVVELKRDGTPRSLIADVIKVRRYWFRAPYRYRFGAVIDLRSNRTAGIRVLRNPNW